MLEIWIQRHNEKYFDMYLKVRVIGNFFLTAAFLYIRIISDTTYFGFPLMLTITAFTLYTLIVNFIVSEFVFRNLKFHKTIFFLQILHVILSFFLAISFVVVIILLTVSEVSHIEILLPIGIDINKNYWREDELAKILLKEVRDIESRENVKLNVVVRREILLGLKNPEAVKEYIRKICSKGR